jgi:hypothetical protein
MKCEWCGSDYPPRGQVYYELQVFQRRHIICIDCYKRLKRVNE